MTTADPTEQTNHDAIPFYRDERYISIIVQVVFAVLMLALVIWLFSNMINALEESGIGTGFGFIGDPARFPIAVAGDLINYTPNDSYGYAFLVGLFNTIVVSIVGVILATILGVATGIGRLSGNWLINRIATVYIAIVRNTPLVVQLVFWYTAIILKIPSIADSVNLLGVGLISNRGTAVAQLKSNAGAPFFWIAFVIALVAAYFISRWRRQRFEETGELPNNLVWAGGAFLGITLIGFLLGFVVAGNMRSASSYPASTRMVAPTQPASWFHQNTPHWCWGWQFTLPPSSPRLCGPVFNRSARARLKPPVRLA